MGDIKQIIHHLKAKGIGVLITDHNVRETLDICETAYIVSDGQLIAEGDAQHPRQPAGQGSLRATNSDCRADFLLGSANRL